MADWEEIKRLAADFQRTQTTGTINRISERNCIDIIKKLIELNYVEIIYSCDGKELITHEQLLREIEDEVHRNGGRMHLHELAAKLNVDYNHIESKADQLVKTNPEYNLILGQIIHSVYKDSLEKRIKYHLLMDGQLSVSEFSKILDLPSDYLLTLLDDILKSSSNEIFKSQDGQTVYTTDTIDRYKSIIKGTLAAIVRPTTVTSLVKRLDLPERILLPIVEGLIKDSEIEASLENKLLIPDSYARQQNEYINKFYSSNSYVEYDIISRLNIKQPKTYLRKKFPEGIQLHTCLISPLLINQVESLIEETIASNSWIDVSTIIPSSIQTEDIEEILAILFKKSKQLQSCCFIFDNTYVCSHGYIETCKRLFEGLMPAKAEEDLKSGKLIAHFMVGQIKPKNQTEDKPVIQPQKDEYDWSDDESTKKSGKGKKSGHVGGGAASQGREVKNKNVKKKYFVSARGSNKKAGQSQIDPLTDQSPEVQLKFQESEEMKTIIERQSSDDCSDLFLMSIVKIIEEDLNKSYVTVARKVFDEFIKTQEEKKANELEEKGEVEDDGGEKENDDGDSLTPA